MVRPPSMKTVQPIRSQPAAWQRSRNQSSMPSAGSPEEVTVGTHIHMPSSSQIQWARYWRWQMEWDLAQSGMCQWSSSPSKTPVGVLPWTCRREGKWPRKYTSEQATLACGLLLGGSEVLRSYKHNQRAQRQGHHTINRLEERGVERRSVRWSSWKGRERAIVNQTNIGTVSKATLGKLFRDGMERIWARA